MTLHVVYDHLCGGCGAFYIPYDAVPCPRCGLVEQERFDYIPRAVESMRYNKQGGSYTPPAWWVGSLGDHVLRLLFGLFDAYLKEPQQGDFEAFLTDQLSGMQWGDQEYLRDHLRGIALRVHDELVVDWNSKPGAVTGLDRQKGGV
jgi:hypothetical protein